MTLSTKLPSLPFLGYAFEIEGQGVRFDVKGRFLRRKTEIVGTAPWCGGVELCIGDGTKTPWIATLQSAVVSELGDLRVLRDPSSLSEHWLDQETCQRLRGADAYDRYQFEVSDSVVKVSASFLDKDREQLRRVLEVAALLAKRGAELRACWYQLADGVGGHIREPRQWQLTAASVIELHRQGTPLEITTEVCGGSRPALQTVVRCSRPLQTGVAQLTRCEVSRERTNESCAVFVVAGYVTDSIRVNAVLDEIVLACRSEEDRDLGPYR